MTEYLETPNGGSEQISLILPVLQYLCDGNCAFMCCILKALETFYASFMVTIFTMNE